MVSSFAFSIIMLAFTGLALAQATTTPPSGNHLGITFNATPRVAAGTQDGLVALAIMQAGTGNAIQVGSLPFTATFGGTLASGHLTDCRVRNVTSLATPLNSNAASIVGGSNTLSFSPVTVGAGSTVTLAVTCDVASNAPVGGTLALSLNPGSVPATISGSSTTVTPVTGVALDGGTGATAGTVTISAQQTTPPPVIPGVPNTGLGGSGTLLVLALAAVFGIGATAALLRRRAV